MHFDIPQPLAPQTISPTHHSYGTRIRKNSVLKPTARLRQSTPPPHPPRRIKPVPSSPTHKQHPQHEDPSLPVFPLPNVMLHTEDASSKVFQAIGRSFLSVDNRAMTVKDLAEMTLKFGLMCQNVSAASQAITTYIRNHLSRCEAQQDHPLLLRHFLSGTPADDELVPALYSRMGGATNPNKTSSKDPGIAEKQTVQPINVSQVERLTNFRRGTMVWYLSKAAGVPCPFARAGIHLCEYGKEGKRLPDTIGDDSHALPNKPKRGHAQCGEKRKRLRRGCRETPEESRQRPSVERDGSGVAIDSGYGEPSDSSDSDSEEEERPPKVKLTLRLRPSVPTVTPPREVIDLNVSPSSEEVSDEDVEMRMASPDTPWTLPPYPRRSIAVPCYTPTCDDSLHPFLARTDARRSPSVPCSASPPPDSDHDELDLDLSADSDFDWDASSMSHSSPANPADTTREGHPGIKEEPQDVRDMLDLWEDLDCAPTNSSTVSSATVKLPADDVKLEEFEFWEWEFENNWFGVVQPHGDIDTDFKDEVGVSEGLPCSLSLRTFPQGAGFPESPCSPFTSFSSSLNSSSSSAPDGAMSSAFRFPSPLTPSSLPFSMRSPSAPVSSPLVQDSPLIWQDTELLGPDSVHPEEFDEGWSDNREQRCSDSMRISNTSPINQPSSTPSQGRLQIQMSAGVPREVEAQAVAKTDTRPPPYGATSDVVVVHTCQPCVPAITATQVEGISVYQTTVGLTPLLRRIDTDFVNLSTILSHLLLPAPSPLPQACVNIVHRLPSVNGIWAPLGIARAYAGRLPGGIRDIFLSDELVMQFPTALQDFHKKSTPGRILNQFGPHFRSSALGNRPLASPAPESNDTPVEKGAVWEAPVDGTLDVVLEEPLVAIPSSFDFVLAGLRPCIPAEDVATPPETPLTPSEQEMFHTLCGNLDWEADKGVEVVVTEGMADDCMLEQPLRRSRRVVDAVVARTRVAQPRIRGPRHC